MCRLIAVHHRRSPLRRIQPASYAAYPVATSGSVSIDWLNAGGTRSFVRSMVSSFHSTNSINHRVYYCFGKYTFHSVKFYLFWKLHSICTCGKFAGNSILTTIQEKILTKLFVSLLCFLNSVIHIINCILIFFFNYKSPMILSKNKGHP